MKNQTGAAILILVLLIVVTVLLVPKYVFLSRQVNLAKAQNIGAYLSSASVLNYVHKKQNPNQGVKISHCQDVLTIFKDTAFPNNYQMINALTYHDIMVNCHFIIPGGRQIGFSVIGVD